MTSQNDQAKEFTRLHVPGQPIVLLNAWDAVSARAIAQVPSCKAIATPSAGVANAIGLDDDDLTLEANLRAVEAIGRVAKEFGKPFSVDLQDGYGEQLEDAVAGIVRCGAVGLNLEDCNKDTSEMMPIAEAQHRIKRVRAASERYGVPDIHINARSDALLHGKSLKETIERGCAYLDAGATTVFVWGGPKRGTTKDEVAQLVKAFDGKLNVSMRFGPGFLGIKELSDMGVARISVGPGMQRLAVQFLSQETERILKDA